MKTKEVREVKEVKEAKEAEAAQPCEARSRRAVCILYLLYLLYLLYFLYFLYLLYLLYFLFHPCQCYDRTPLGATRFRRKLSRPEGMPGATCPQSGGKTELPTHRWLWLPS